MRKEVIVVPCLLLFGCSTPQRWVKVEGSGTQSSQDSGALRKVLGECAAAAAEAHEKYLDDVDALFGSNSAHANFHSCMSGKGYVKG